MKKKDKTTEEAILIAAQKAFTKKGMSGARMQDIADEAGINKALVHYYFGSKEKLFTLIFEQEFKKLFFNLAEVISSDAPLFKKIEHIIVLDIARLSQFPDLPLFVINEVARNPSIMAKRLKQMGVLEVLDGFQKQVDTDIKKGLIRNISAMQLLINIQSLCIFPFVARPMVKNVFNMNEQGYQVMMERRKKEITRFIINAIKI